MTEDKPQTQLPVTPDNSATSGTQGRASAPQRTPTVAFPAEAFLTTSPTAAFPPMFFDPTAANAQQLGQDQPFMGISSALGTTADGATGLSLLSPSFRFFPNSTPTALSPHLSMFGFGTPFGQSPTSGFPFGFSPFCQTPTNGFQLQQPTTPNSAEKQQAFKTPFPPDSKDTAATVLQQMKSESDPVSPAGPLFPNIAQFPREAPQFNEANSTDTLMSKSVFPSGIVGALPTSSSSAKTSPAAQQGRGKPSGRGRRGRHPPTSPILTTAPSVGVRSAQTETSPDGSTSSTSPVSPSGRKRQARRPPPLDVSPRSTELASTEVPMSAFRLVVGAQKLCKFRRYSVTLTIPKLWRVEHGISEEKVMKSLLDAKCCRSGTSVIAGCPRCKCQPVVTLVATSKWLQASSVSDGNENYTCSIRTRCSSSRDHLKSSLTLVVDSLPLSEYIVSNSFVLLARDKTQAPKRSRGYELGQSGGDSGESDDDMEDEKDQKGESNGEMGRGSSNELPRKSARRASSTLTKRKQKQQMQQLQQQQQQQLNRSSDPKVMPKLPMNSSNVVGADPISLANKAASFQQTAALMGAMPQTAAAAVVVNNGAGGERMYNMDSGSSLESGAQSVVYSSGGKSQSPIQPSSVSLPSPTPCSTPTGMNGMFCETMAANNYDANQMEQMGWPLSPMMSGAPLQQ